MAPSRVVQVGLEVRLEVLDERIESSFVVDGRRAAGRSHVALLERPGGLSRTARQAVGYRQLLRTSKTASRLEECVERRHHPEPAASPPAAIRGSRRDPRIEWFEDPAAAVARLVDVLNGSDGFVRD